MVARLLTGPLVLAGLLFTGPAFRTNPRATPGPAPSSAHRTFTRRRSAAEEDERGEFVHAIDRGRAERPLGSVRS
jgi:hypothetical protein